MLTQARVRELFDYDADRGRLRWRETGEIAGGPEKPTKPYWRVRIDGKLYRCSHVIWLWHHGVLPADQIDHADLDKTNDRIGNLREADNAQNKENNLVRRDSQSGLKRVGLDHRSPGHWRFRANITAPKGKRISKCFATIDEAVAWQRQIAARLHGRFARE